MEVGLHCTNTGAYLRDTWRIVKGDRVERHAHVQNFSVHRRVALNVTVQHAASAEVYMKTSCWTPICLSVWKVLLPVCPNVISQFKDAQRAKAEHSRTAREGRREAAAFTVSHESLQPTVLDLCHARSLLLSFFPSHSVFLSVPGQAHWGAQPTSSLHMAPPPKTGNTVMLVSSAQRRVGGRWWEGGGGEREEDRINISSPWRWNCIETASEGLDDAQTHTYGEICFPSQTMKSAKCPKKIFQHHLQRADDTLLRKNRPLGNTWEPGLLWHAERRRKENTHTHAEIASCVYSPSSTPVFLHPHF